MQHEETLSLDEPLIDHRADRGCEERICSHRDEPIPDRVCAQIGARTPLWSRQTRQRHPPSTSDRRREPQLVRLAAHSQDLIEDLGDHDDRWSAYRI